MAKSLIGQRVVNKRNISYGTIVKFDDESVYIEVDNVGIKCVTWNNFKKWWEEYKEEQQESTSPVEDINNAEVQANGTAVEIYDKFISVVKSYGDSDIIVFLKDASHAIVKCGGKAIFDINICKKKVVVYAHPNSLTPDNMRRAVKVYPKEWNRSLRAKYIFTSIDQLPLMKTIISDGIFYRKDI